MSKWYFGLTTLYGFARTFPVFQKTELPGTALMTLAVGTISAPIFMPAFLANDMNRFYLKIHNLDPLTHGYRVQVRQNLADLLFE